MKTGHGPGKGAVSISTTLTREEGQAMDQLAKNGGHSRSAWARHALKFAISNGFLFRVSVENPLSQLGQLPPDWQEKSTPQSPAAAGFGGGGAARPVDPRTSGMPRRSQPQIQRKSKG